VGRRTDTIIQVAHFGHRNQLTRKPRQAGELRRPRPEIVPPFTYTWRSAHDEFSPSLLCSCVKRRLKIREQCPRKLPSRLAEIVTHPRNVRHSTLCSLRLRAQAGRPWKEQPPPMHTCHAAHSS